VVERKKDFLGFKSTEFSSLMESEEVKGGVGNGE
jgi:hypothetical protein